MLTENGISASGVGRSERYFVPDLSPIDRQELGALEPRYVFVAESPHVSEVEPDSIEARRPLCGAAGRQWWGRLGEILTGEKSDDVSFDRMKRLCQKHRIAVINAVQYPMDPKISSKYPDAEPVRNLGFFKGCGEFAYKKKNARTEAAIRDLRARLSHPRMARAQIWALGNDAQWFVVRALEGQEARVGGKIPHPSAWWRRGGLFGRMAQETLEGIFKKA